MMPATAAAYDALRNAKGHALRWPDREVAVFLRAADHKELPLARIEKALRAAMKTWSAVAGTRLDLVWGGLVREATGFDIYVEIATPGGGQLGPERRARLALYSEDDGTLTRAEIALDGALWTFTTGPSLAQGPRADLQATFTHHLGHALGLAHTPRRSAAMYFFRPDLSGRLLDEDDRRGLRFAYPAEGPVAIGDLCDACDGDAWCASGVCATWPSGDSYCVRPCESHGQCPIGHSCGTWAGGKACLPNALHCAPDLVKAGASGACASDLACPQPLSCLSGFGTGMCTIGCSSNCGPYGQCVSFKAGSATVGLCLKRGGAGYGARCTRALDCQSMLCSPALAGGGWCAKACSTDAGCPASSVCDTDGRCARPGSLPTGWPCESGFDCKSGRCAPFGGEKWSRVCATTCEVAGDCPEGTGCTPAGDDLSYCLPYGPLGDGAPCKTPGACGAGTLCDRGPIEGVGTCQVACDPFGDDTACPVGKRCVWVGDKSPLSGACRSSGGGALPAAPCDAETPCRVDLVCAGPDASSGRCRWDCDVDVPPGGGGGCPAGQLCVPLNTTSASGKRRGACAAAKGGLVEIPPVAAKAENFAAREIALPAVKPWPGAPEPASEDDTGAGGGGGCAAGPAGSSRATWPLALLAALALLWRRP